MEVRGMNRRHFLKVSGTAAVAVTLAALPQVSGTLTVADLPPEKQKMLDRLHHSDDALVGKKVVVVDDDVRNIFALSSVLERRGMTVLSASTGREAAWQAALDQAGASRTVILTPATGSQLAAVVRQGLDGAAMQQVAGDGLDARLLQAGAHVQLEFLPAFQRHHHGEHHERRTPPWDVPAGKPIGPRSRHARA